MLVVGYPDSVITETNNRTDSMVNISHQDDYHVIILCTWIYIFDKECVFLNRMYISVSLLCYIFVCDSTDVYTLEVCHCLKSLNLF